MKKCNAIKGKWCNSIKQVADFGNPDATGLAVSSVMDINTYAKGFGLRLGLPKELRKKLNGKYIWCNFCPFCGADTSKRVAEKK